ncbi:hypothetical protein T09_6348 [Trichinella sp. T9]|nr:hypothetical protein T09_6348 [Trichinella sp. T9]
MVQKVLFTTTEIENYFITSAGYSVNAPFHSMDDKTKENCPYTLCDETHSSFLNDNLYRLSMSTVSVLRQM